MNLIKNNVFSIATILLLFMSLFSCSKNTEEQQEDEESLIQAVRVETLSKSALRKFIEVNGNIRAEKSMNVYPVIQGKIAGSLVRLGTEVKKGDVIAYVDPSAPGLRYSLNEVISPISGTVISIPLKEGTRVDTETAVAVIGDLSKLELITYIPESYVSFLQQGLDADVVLKAYPEETFHAIVSDVSPVLDEATRTKEIVLNFTELDSRINAGMFAGLKLYLKDYKDVFSVPTSCIIEKNGKKYVYVIDVFSGSSTENNPKVRLVEIETGEEIESRTIINFTFSENAPVKNNSSALKVVVQGFETLQDGSSVNIAE